MLASNTFFLPVSHQCVPRSSIANGTGMAVLVCYSTFFSASSLSLLGFCHWDADIIQSSICAASIFFHQHSTPNFPFVGPGCQLFSLTSLPSTNKIICPTWHPAQGCQFLLWLLHLLLISSPLVILRFQRQNNSIIQSTAWFASTHSPISSLDSQWSPSFLSQQQLTSVSLTFLHFSPFTPPPPTTVITSLQVITQIWLSSFLPSVPDGFVDRHEGPVEIQAPASACSSELIATDITYAFSLHGDVICSAYPAHCQEIDDYLTTALNLDFHFGGKGFYHYHIRFEFLCTKEDRKGRKIDVWKRPQHLPDFQWRKMQVSVKVPARVFILWQRSLSHCLLPQSHQAMTRNELLNITSALYHNQGSSFICVLVKGSSQQFQPGIISELFFFPKTSTLP